MTILKASEGWIQEELALLQVMFLEIIGFNRNEKLYILSADTILQSFLQPSDDVMSEVFSLADLQKARDGCGLQDEDSFWNKSKASAFISLTLSGLLKPYVWNVLHARYLGSGNSVCSPWFCF